MLITIEQNDQDQWDMSAESDTIADSDQANRCRASLLLCYVLAGYGGMAMRSGAQVARDS